MSIDPLGVWGDPQSFGSGYGYGTASPLVQSDPTGLQVFLSELVNQLGIQPGQRVEFERPMSAPSGTPFIGVGRSDDGRPYAFGEGGGRELFKLYDFQTDQQRALKKIWLALNGSLAGVPGLVISDPHNDLCPSSVSDHVAEELGGFVPWAAAAKALRWASRAGKAADNVADAAKAANKVADAAERADKVADVARGSDDVVDLYRFVSPGEFDDITRTGRFAFGEGMMEAKQFGLKFEEVLRLSDHFNDAAAIMRARVGRSALQGLDMTPVDAFILRSGSVTARGRGQLRLLNESLIGPIDHIF